MAFFLCSLACLRAWLTDFEKSFEFGHFGTEKEELVRNYLRKCTIPCLDIPAYIFLIVWTIPTKISIIIKN